MKGGWMVEYHQDGKGESRNHATSGWRRSHRGYRYSRKAASRSRKRNFALTSSDGGACS